MEIIFLIKKIDNVLIYNVFFLNFFVIVNKIGFDKVNIIENIVISWLVVLIDIFKLLVIKLSVFFIINLIVLIIKVVIVKI